ncbi:MAG: dihydroorotase [Phycisphaerales bacterium]|jgi:dihydroorotase|nr:dihydroorotase [Phycisphaerales bacterium]
MTALLLTGGRIIDPASELDHTGDVLIREGLIAAISKERITTDAPRIACEGCIVAPGLLDIHVHFRDPDTSGHHEETLDTGAAAAAAGGFSTVCCMPNTTPAIDCRTLVEHIGSRSAQAGHARVFPVACGTIGRRGETVAPILELIESGAVGISDDGDGIADSGIMRRVLALVAAADSVFMQHCQDPTLTRAAAMNAGSLATRLGLTGWPREAEEVMLRRDLALNRSIGARYHAQHLSVAQSIDALREARAEGQPATGEASPHHLLLTEDACEGWNTLAKVNPPLRTNADIDAIKRGIAEGIITVLATDHAPHPAHTKDTDFASAAFGMVGLECALPLYREAIIEGGVLDWPGMLRMMTCEPARVAGLAHLGLGRLESGGPADVTVIDPDAEWTIDPTSFQSRGRNCPFAGRSVRGRALTTIVAGRIRHQRASDRTDAAIEDRAEVR